MSAEGPWPRLGELLTATEARQLADRLEFGDTVSRAVVAVAQSRRPEVEALLRDADRATLVAVLRAIETSAVRLSTARPTWTVPSETAQQGRLHSSIGELVDGAREALTCATFNFQRSSTVWKSLLRVASRPGLEMRLYVDHEASLSSTRGTLTPEVLAAQLPGARIFESARGADGRWIRSHAKFIVVDHQIVHLTSANFSVSAERRNVELGLRVEDAALAQLIEEQLRALEASAYQPVGQGLSGS